MVRIIFFKSQIIGDPTFQTPKVARSRIENNMLFGCFERSSWVKDALYA
jgi:hypothetical protein